MIKYLINWTLTPINFFGMAVAGLYDAHSHDIN